MRFFRKACVLLLVVSIAPLFSLLGQSGKIPEVEAQVIWEKISPYFSVPAVYKGEYGDYTSPFIFNNGDTVKTAADWNKRREEIRSKWQEMMGNWPPLLEDQEMEILWKSTRKEGFSEYRVSFNWTPHEKTAGYLLIPVGEGKKPAVIT